MFFAIGFCYLFLGTLIYLQLRNRKQFQLCMQQVKYLQKHVQDIAPIVNSVNLHCQNLEQAAQNVQNNGTKNSVQKEQQENYVLLRKQMVHLEQKLGDLKTQCDNITSLQGTTSDIVNATQMGLAPETSWGMVSSSAPNIENRSNFNSIAEDMMRRNLEWLKSTDLPL